MRKLALAALVVTTAALAGCNDSSGPAYGDYTSIIAVMDPSVWAEVEDTVTTVMEPTIRTVRNEKTFQVTYQDPTGPEWGNLRRFRQILMVGTGDEDWMQEALEKTRNPVTGPGLYRAYDVWSRGQQITIILAPAADQVAAIQQHAEDIHQTLDQQFRSWARNRMFLSGMDSALADTVSQMAGFRLLVPNVYTWKHEDSIYTFRNDQPDPAELIRQVAVTWKSPIPLETMTTDQVIQWRNQVATTYNEPQLVDTTDVADSTFDHMGHPARELQTVWTNPPELNWPAGGPLLTRTITCPQQDRVYLLDAWLYAPGKEKYEYMLQLQNILDSFQCGAS